MPVRHPVELFNSNVKDPELELKEIVMGLHWDPATDVVPCQPTDLDALCVLFDSYGRVLEVIHPGHPRSDDGSVIHTGDSRSGASSWDDERIFVFLEALPKAASKLAFIVFSATGQPFDAVRGAFCHLSDRVSEVEWARIELTSLVGRTAWTVANLHRGAAGWEMSTDGEPVESGLVAELRVLVGGAK